MQTQLQWRSLPETQRCFTAVLPLWACPPPKACKIISLGLTGEAVKYLSSTQILVNWSEVQSVSLSVVKSSNKRYISIICPSQPPQHHLFSAWPCCSAFKRRTDSKCALTDLKMLVQPPFKKSSIQQQNNDYSLQI